MHRNLNYKWDEVHTEAEKLEHVCTDKFIDMLEKYLGFPRFDPHGDPIPDKNGRTEKVTHINLSEARAGGEYVITKVNDSSNEILKYLTTIGMKLKSKIRINRKIEFDGSVLVSHKSRKQLLSSKMSENIFITEAA